MWETQVAIPGRGHLYSHKEWVEQIYYVAEWMTDSTHLPVQDTNHARLGGVEHEIVNLKVAVNKSRSVLWLERCVAKEVDEGVELRVDGPHGVVSVHVGRLRLGIADGFPGEELAGVEA